MTCSELDVERTLELARRARGPSAVDEQRVLDALRSRIQSTPLRAPGRAACRLQLVRARAERAARSAVDIDFETGFDTAIIEGEDAPPRR